MTREQAAIDISSMPELIRLVEDVQRTQRPQRLRRGNVDVAVIVPVPPADASPPVEKSVSMTLDEFLQQADTPPTDEELARRQEVIARTLEHRKNFVITPLTTADLIRIAREEEYQSYGGDR